MTKDQPNSWITKSREQLYFNGHTNIALSSSAFLKNLLSQLQKLDCDDLSKHNSFLSNYEMTYDLKREADFNKTLIQLLFDQDIINKINSITGREYVLGDIVLRKSLNKKSYMPWHRDTYLDKKGNLVGRVPPLLKLMFYPRLTDSLSHELLLLSGSTKLRFNNYYLDKLNALILRGNEKKIFQANDSCELIDSSIMHSAMPHQHNSNGSFRIIYNFCDKSQLNTFPNATSIHRLFNDEKNGLHII